jgi:hypothetical protein
MRTHNIHPFFRSITADEVFTPNADTLSIVNNGDDDVSITMNETTLVLKSGWDLSLDGGENGFIADPITIAFSGTSKDLLIIEGRKESIPL